MATPTPQQRLRVDRFEAVIGLFAPVLDLVLTTGERLSTALGREDDYYPIRSPGESFELAPSDLVAAEASEEGGPPPEA